MSDVERLREGFAVLGEKAVPGDDCPQPERLWAAAHGELRRREIHELVDHTSSCAACAEAWRLARDLGEGSQEAAPERPARPRTAAWWRPGTLAAAALVLMVVGFQLSNLLRRAPVHRDAGEVGIRSLVPDDQALPRQRCLLRWSGGGEGARYTVHVTDETLEAVAGGRRLEIAEYLVPEQNLAGLEPGARLLWRVEAVQPAGGRLLSETFVAVLE